MGRQRLMRLTPCSCSAHARPSFPTSSPRPVRRICYREPGDMKKTEFERQYHGKLTMICRLLLSLVLSIAAADGASAQGRAVYGAGLLSCGQWQEYRTTGNKGASFQLQAWIDGFLSGYNMASSGPDIIIKEADKPGPGFY